MQKKSNKIVIEEVAEFANKFKGLLFIVANPQTDELFTSYGGKYSFIKFTDEKFVIQRVVSPDMFELSIDEFMGGVIDTLKLQDDRYEDINLIKAVGGSVKAVGEALLDNQEEHASKKETKGRGTKGGSTKGGKASTKANR